MLTPQEISGKELVKAVFGGYDMSTVDDFIEEISTDYGALFKENAILKSKIKVLVEKVEEYRSTEDAMRMALLTAQKMGEELVSEATKKSDAMRSDAELEVKLMHREMKKKLADEEARLTAAQRETSKFVIAAQELMRQHAAFLSRLEDIKSEAPAPVSAPDPGVPAKEAERAVSPEEKDTDTKLYKKDTGEINWDDDEPTSPRPRFDFENLKFGANFSEE